MGNTQKGYEYKENFKKEQLRKNLTASDLVEQKLNPNTFKKAFVKMLSLTSQENNNKGTLSSRSFKKDDSQNVIDPNLPKVSSNKVISKTTSPISIRNQEQSQSPSRKESKNLPSIEINFSEVIMLKKLTSAESNGLIGDKIDDSVLGVPSNAALKNLEENSIAVSESKIDENCPRCTQAQQIKAEKKELKKSAKNYQKMSIELEDQVNDLKSTIEYYRKQIEEVKVNKQNIEEHVEKYQTENIQIIEKQTILENQVKDTLDLISKKLPKAANLRPENMKKIAALIETPEDFLIKCQEFNVRLIFDGELDEETDSIKHGYGKLLYENGSLFFSGEFRNDKIYGNIIRFYYEGEDENSDLRLFLKIQSDSSEKLPIDEISGKVFEYYNNDAQSEKFTSEIKNGIPNGKAIEFYENGLKKFEGIYENGLRNGSGKEFYEKTSKESVKYDGFYVNNQKEGFFKEYFESGKEKFVGHFENDVKHGQGKLYYESGQLVYVPFQDNNNNVLVWTNGQLNGENVDWFNSDGSIIAKGLNFKNGKIIGASNDCHLYFQNGKNWMFRNAIYNENGNIHISKQKNTHEYRDLIDERKGLWGEQYFQTYMSPSLIFKYIGTYNDGKKEGYGKYLFGTDVLFDGFWKENIPYKNYDKKYQFDGGIVVFLGVSLSVRGGMKINPQFRGTVLTDENGWLYGDCEIFDPFRDDFKIRLYKGKFRAPTLDSIILMTLDLELCDYNALLPKNNSLVR